MIGIAILSPGTLTGGLAMDIVVGMDNTFAQAFAEAVRMLLHLDADVLEIIGLSLEVSLSAVFIAALVGMPAGAALALWRFPGRQPVVVLVSSLMGLPPVLLGLIVYLLLSRSGPLGVLGLLYTPTAMIIAQVLLVLPIIVALSQRAVAGMWEEYAELMRSLHVRGLRLVATMLYEARLALMTVGLAAFGRAIAEVGAVMIVGGNINHATRVMTTAIALETSRGNLALAVALGLVLLLLAVLVNAGVHVVARIAGERGMAAA